MTASHLVDGNVDTYELTPLQQGMLFHAISARNSGVDIEQIVMTLHEALNLPAFMAAWAIVIGRHSILRTRFQWEEVDEPQQQVMAKVSLPVTQVDWSDQPFAAAEDLFAQRLKTDRRQDFDLAIAPMMRLFVARLAEDHYRVLWTFHHALLDGRSFPIVLQEVFALYEASMTGETVSLPAPVAFRRYIEWRQSRNLSGADTFWRDALRGFRTPTAFHIDRTDLDSSSHRGFDIRQTRLSASQTSQLRVAAKAADVTLNTLLQGAWAVLLHRYSGESDVVFGATMAGRDIDVEADSRSWVGLFINSLPVRVNVDDGAEVVPWLQALRAQQQAIRAHQDISLAAVQSLSTTPRGTSLFESLVVYEHESLDAQLRSLGGNWLGRHFEYTGQTNFPLSVIAYGDDEMLIRLEYSQQRFADASIERMLAHLISLLTDLSSGTATRLGELRMLTAAERAELLHEGVELERFDVGGSIHERFTQQVMTRPTQIALVAFDADGSRIELSYAELDARAERVAIALRARRVGAGQIVGLRTERDAELVVGMLGILKAGAAYLPLDPVYPPERVRFLVSDAAVSLVLTQRGLAADLSGLPIELLCLDEQARWEDPAASVASLSSPDDLAYVIYTSGSSGEPKGVGITHRNVMRLFLATEHWFGFNEHDVWTLFHSYAFDFSVWELWGALLYGGRVVVVSHDISRNTEAFRELLLREAVTVLNQTPSAFRQLIDVDRAGPPGTFALRHIIFGGEALELQSLRPWMERYGDTTPRLINMYGITETTVHVTYRPITWADLEQASGSVIGEPIRDLRVYLLDAHAQPVPIGVPGEMYVAGAGVARGYLNRPALTAQRFVPNPFVSDPTARMYRSGDLARRLLTGELEYLGRIDQQVKIRGFRIELGEIEAVIRQHPLVRQVAVIDREDNPGEKRLVAYLVVTEPLPTLISALRDQLHRALPHYMMPAHFIFVPTLQLTPNGKLDRNALPATDSARIDTSRQFRAPRNATEQAIADVWKAVLRLERVGIDDHFFELGGDSILSIQVIARCRQRGLRLTPKDLFKSPTIAQLAQLVTGAPSAQSHTADPEGSTVPLTPIQQWFFAQRFAQAHHWNQAFLFEVAADFDVAIFQQALVHVARQHDALRFRYDQDGDVWRQRCGGVDVDAPVQRVDLAHLTPDRQAIAITERSARAQTQLNLAGGPILRAVHFSLGSATRGRLLLAIHHLVVDGVSWRVLREDLEFAYLAIRDGTAPKLPDSTSSMRDWAQRLKDYAQTPGILRAFEHWRAANQVDPARLPPDNSTAIVSSTEAQVVLELTEAETRALLQQLPAVFRTQINDVLLYALVSALQRSVGGSTFKLDLEGHGREHIADDLDVSRTVGWFTTLFPVVLEVLPGDDMLTALLAVRDQLRRVPHRGISFGLLRYLSNDAQIRGALAADRPAAVLFNYLGQFDAVVMDSELFTFARESTGPWRSPAARRTHALEIVSRVRDSRLEIDWHYDAGVHGETTITRVANDMITVLRELLALAATAPDVRFTPADFPLARLGPATLTTLLSRYPQVQDIYALTSMQQLFFAMETSQSNLGFEQWHFRIDGAMDAQLLRRAIEYVIARHSILRTAFVADGGADPVQIVCRKASMPWSEEDWRTHSSADQATRIGELLRADAKAGFDLAQAPMMRIALRRLADTSWHFVWSTHHLCIDGWSWPLVFTDVSRAYAALESGAEPALEPATPFRDYVEWLAELNPQSEDFWKDQLQGFVAPTPFRLGLAPVPKSQTPTDQFQELAIALPADVTAALQALARKEKLTLSVVINAAWSLLLSHYSASRTVFLGASYSGRPAEMRGIESMIGPCVNNLPVRVDVAAEETLGAWLARLQRRQFDIAQHQYVPLDQIQQWANIPWRYRLFDSLIVFQNYQVDDEARRIGTGARTTLLAAPEATNYALTLAVTMQDTLRVRFIYPPTALTAADVQQFATDLEIVLQAMARSGTTTLATILGKLPQALRGKANELVLAKSLVQSAAYSAPMSDAERVIAAVWQDLFEVARVSLDDNFFEIGGHSLLLVRAHAQLKTRLRIDLPIVALLQYPTIRALARHLTEAPSGPPASQAAIDRSQKQREAQARRRTQTGKGGS